MGIIVRGAIWPVVVVVVIEEGLKFVDWGGLSLGVVIKNGLKFVVVIGAFVVDVNIEGLTFVGTNSSFVVDSDGPKLVD